MIKKTLIIILIMSTALVSIFSCSDNNNLIQITETFKNAYIITVSTDKLDFEICSLSDSKNITFENPKVLSMMSVEIKDGKTVATFNGVQKEIAKSTIDVPNRLLTAIEMICQSFTEHAVEYQRIGDVTIVYNLALDGKVVMVYYNIDKKIENITYIDQHGKTEFLIKEIKEITV